MSRIAVAGAGTWGIALARMLLLSGHEVSVWSALPEEIDELSANRTHKNLPGMVIPDEMVFSKDLVSVCSGAEVIVMAVPSVFVRSTAKTLAPLVSGDQIIVALQLVPQVCLCISLKSFHYALLIPSSS